MRRGRCFLWLWLIAAALLVPYAGARASGERDAVFARAIELGLAQHPQWLRLLHYDRKGQASEILTSDFFLSAQGAHDPGAELQQTISAWFAPWGEDPNTHPRCRFPARYFWLAQQLPLPGYAQRELRCRKLERWAAFDRLQSVSLMLVSGYFGNPASTFGHALLRFNREGAPEAALLDTTLNFGALVPPNELTPVYVYRGLFGGYQAGFSDRYFYTQDLMYSFTQKRDMWEYELALESQERVFLLMHTWEIIGKKFTYYFLTLNCGYRLAELIEMVTGQALLVHTRVWLTPIETFHRLHELERSSGPDRRKLIAAVRFIPSSERIVRWRWKHLQPDDLTLSRRVVREGFRTAATDASFSSLPLERKHQLLEALLAYYQYRLASDDPPAQARAAKDELLRERLRLPPDPTSLDTPPSMRSPALGSAPMLAAAGIGHTPHSDSHIWLQWAAFSRDALGENELDGGELVVADVGAAAKRSAVVLERVDVIRIRKLAADAPIGDEGHLSWQLRLGAGRITPDARDSHAPLQVYGRFGTGYAARHGGMTGYAMLDAGLRGRGSALTLEPNLGVIAAVRQWKLWVAGRMSFEPATGLIRGCVGAQAGRMLAHNYSLRLELDCDSRKAARLAVHAYF